MEVAIWPVGRDGHFVMPVYGIHIQGVLKKTHFLNCRFAKPDLRIYGLPLPVGWKAIYPQTYFLNSRNSESAFFGQTIWCSIAIAQSAIPWLAETMFALLVP